MISATSVYTAAVRHSHHDYRLTLIGDSKEQMCAGLDAFLAEQPDSGVAWGRASGDREVKPVFVFSGVGSQWPSMGLSLLREEPVFREVFEQCDDIVRRHEGWSLIEEIEAEHSVSRLDRIDIMQPAIFTIQSALTALWRSWGVEPSAVIGHSLGEFAAAHAAGALPIEQALRAVCVRGRLMNQTSGKGIMVAVELTPEQAGQVVAAHSGLVSLAAWNSPSATVLSGDPGKLEEIMTELEAKEVFCRRLKVDVACHSFQMEEIADELLANLSFLEPSPPSVPIYSTVTASAATGGEFTAPYWVRNLTSTVKFAPLVEELLTSGQRLFLEISPHSVLQAPIQQVAQRAGKEVATPVSLKRDQDEGGSLLEALGALYVHGCPVDWGKHYPSGGSVVDLPTYKWQRERYWIPEITAASGGSGGQPEIAGSFRHPFLGTHWESAAQPGTHFWEVELDKVNFPFLGHHRFQKVPLLPGAFYLEMGLSASITVFGEGPRVFHDFEVLNPVFLPDNKAATIQLIMSPDRPGTSTVQFYALEGRENGHRNWVLSAKAKLQYADIEFESESEMPASPRNLEARYSEQMSGESFYEFMKSHGPPFRGVERAYYNRGEDHIVASIRLPEESAAVAGPFRIHPTLMDTMIHCDAVRRVCHRREGFKSEVLAGIARLEIREIPDPTARYWALAEKQGSGQHFEKGDVTIFDENGRVVLRDEGNVTKSFAIDAGLGDPLETDRGLYDLVWEPAERSAPREENRSAWLILGDRAGLGRRLRDRLREDGDLCVLITSDEMESKPEGGLRSSVEDFVKATQSTPRGVVHLWPLDSPANADLSIDSLVATQKLLCGSIVEVVQSLTRTGSFAGSRLWIVTRYGQATGLETEPIRIAQSPVFGLARMVANEFPELGATRVDLDVDADEMETAPLLAELRMDDSEREVALRRERRYGLRLSRHDDRSAQAPVTHKLRAKKEADHSYELGTNGAGVLENLSFVEVPRRTPGLGEIEIQVSVAGLNFLDVLKALGMAPGLPDGPLLFGMECCGQVVAIGEGVTRFRVGDEVIAKDDAGSGCLRAFLTINERWAFPKPAHLSLAEAATMPVAYMTAHYSLHHLARVRRGESVLIHSAAGGVGLAAVALAKRLGAEVLATAGTPEKREYLKTLGVRHVMDSRTLAFAGEIISRTGGRGVDVVLNSLAGEAIPKSLSALATRGRFVEIGKRDIYDSATLNLLPFQKNLSFFAVDLLRLSRERPEIVEELWREVIGLIADGSFQPLPFKRFPAAEVADAFHMMAQGKHTGKILIDLADCEVDVERRLPGQDSINADSTYLITGGLGGLGLSVAQWLVEKGARHLALVGRRGAPQEADPLIEALRKAGAEPRVFAADVSRPEHVSSVLAQIRDSMPPLAGVFHCAGLLEDGVLDQLDWSRFEPVFAPKMQGSWNLHTQLEHTPLDFFVLFSSAASMFGGRAQGNYAAANAFLDGLAHYRQALGLPALAINWGPWSEVGMAAKRNRADRLANQGFPSISPKAGVRILGNLLGRGVPQVAAVAIDWDRWCEVFPGARKQPLVSRFVNQPTTDSGPVDGEKSVIDSVLEAADRQQALDILVSYLGDVAGKVLRVPPSRLDPDIGLKRSGLDSLMAVELRNRIEFDLSLAIPVVRLLQGPSLRELAELLSAELDKAAGALSGLSDEEVDTILVQEGD